MSGGNMNEDKLQLIMDVLDSMYPDAACELNYSNPLELLIAVMLSAQTTDASVNRVTPALFERYHSAKDYAEASQADLEEMIHAIGLFRNKAKNIKAMAQKLLEDFDGEVPQSHKELESLPGVGRKTANVVMAEAFHYPSVPVDTHVARISKRLGLADPGDSVLVIEKKLREILPRERWIKMHHQFIFFGRYHCKAQNPQCKECQLIKICLEENKKK